MHTVAWLSQANHIFSSLGITFDLGDYGTCMIIYSLCPVTCSIAIVLVDGVQFKITLSHPWPLCTPGYLFLCPPAEFQIGAASYRWPESPAYWTLDPTGAHRLSTEEATILGFPEFELDTSISGLSWDTSVYAGLRKFHAAKGFNPDSQDVALHLGEPLYVLTHGAQLFRDGKSIIIS
ncbi:hypothetical protein C8R46DRAFT_905875 [Mycena filopes]|nr:hypothetical protein C8R46DRAFT_905875 [Mycena filopes]